MTMELNMNALDMMGFEELSEQEMMEVDGGGVGDIFGEVFKVLAQAAYKVQVYEYNLFISGAMTSAPGYNPALVHVGLQPNPSPATAAASRR